jgi:hypothetical protein
MYITQAFVVGSFALKSVFLAEDITLRDLGIIVTITEDPLNIELRRPSDQLSTLLGTAWTLLACREETASLNKLIDART